MRLRVRAHQRRAQPVQDCLRRPLGRIASGALWGGPVVIVGRYASGWRSLEPAGDLPRRPVLDSIKCILKYLEHTGHATPAASRLIAFGSTWQGDRPMQGCQR